MLAHLSACKLVLNSSSVVGPFRILAHLDAGFFVDSSLGCWLVFGLKSDFIRLCLGNSILRNPGVSRHDTADLALLYLYGP